jgi:hypothetical protein
MTLPACDKTMGLVDQSKTMSRQTEFSHERRSQAQSSQGTEAWIRAQKA